MVDLAIGGNAWISERFESSAILIGDGKVIDIISKSNVPQGLPFFDFGNNWLLPGLVDIHVHLRDFLESQEEDFTSGTRAAVAGGFATVLCMPNTMPPINNPNILEEAQSKADEMIWCDLGFHVGLATGPDDVRGALNVGGFGVKIYPEDFVRIQSEPGWIEALRSMNALVYIHAEDKETIDAKRRLLIGPLKGAGKHSQIRSADAEVRAIEKSLRDLKALKLHFAHITTSEGIRMLSNAKEATFEVTVHHLALTDEVMSLQGGVAKVNPPLRSSRDVAALRASVNNGLPIAIVSDHAPHLVIDKKRENYDDIPSGFPGLETAFGVLCSLARRGELQIDEVIKDLTSKPVRKFGLKEKGSIAMGTAADFVIVDPSMKWKVNASEFQSKSKLSPFEGLELQGRVIATMVRGDWAFKDGEPTEVPRGRVIRGSWN